MIVRGDSSSSSSSSSSVDGGRWRLVTAPLTTTIEANRHCSYDTPHHFSVFRDESRGELINYVLAGRHHKIGYDESGRIVLSLL